jgi:hypothetical protein
MFESIGIVCSAAGGAADASSHTHGGACMQPSAGQCRVLKMKVTYSGGELTAHRRVIAQDFGQKMNNSVRWH